MLITDDSAPVAAINKTNNASVAILVSRNIIYHHSISNCGCVTFIRVLLAPSSIVTFECRTLRANHTFTSLSSKPGYLDTFISNVSHTFISSLASVHVRSKP